MAAGRRWTGSVRLRELRTARGLSQPALALRAGVSTRTLQRIEAGAVLPTIATLRLLTQALEVDLLDLVEAGALMAAERRAVPGRRGGHRGPIGGAHDGRS